MKLHRVAVVLASLTVLVTAACTEEQGAFGDASSIVAAVPLAAWTAVEDSVYGALEPTIYTVRDEKMFTVTHVDPQDATWDELRRFRQLLVVGPADAPWIAPVIDGVRKGDPIEGVIQASDVWARGQTVTAVVVPAGQSIEEGLRSALGELNELYDAQYRQLAEGRMFISGPDTALADTLRSTAGFSLLLPVVYTWASRDSVYVFRNDNPDPSELIRQVAVTWASPIPDGMEGEDFLAWREELATQHYTDEQVNVLDNVEAGRFNFAGLDAYQIQAVWQSPPGAWPAGGPFVLRAVACPAQDRMYLIDAWLYAPGKEKYQYMIQLEKILDSFECG